jgi:acyl dehydratase
MATLFDGVRQVAPLIVAKAYSSDWSCVTQDQIDAFAAATRDNQWIHRADAEHAASPFGGPIAHGLLLVSLAITLARECGALEDASWVLYGFDKLRFRAPVRSGAVIRCVTMIRGTKELGDGTLLDARFVMEIKDQQVPAFVADCLLLRASKALRNGDLVGVRPAD